MVFPGDKLASIEEFVAGSGSAIVGDEIVSTIVGSIDPELSNRVMYVSSFRSYTELLPKKGEDIIGFVESTQTATAQIVI